MRPIRQAVILAGGMGMRLRPLTIATPKPMIPFYGKPFLAYTVEELKVNGIREVILLVGYLHHQIEAYFGNGKSFGLTIRYLYDPVDADTGQRIKHVLPLLRKHFLLLYGDNYWPLRLDKLSRAYLRFGKKALVTVYSNLDKSTRNNMFVDGAGIVKRYDKSRTDSNLNGVDIGFFIFDRDVLNNLPEENFSFEKVIIPRLIRQKQLSGFMTHHKYYSLSTPDRIPIIQRYFKTKKVIFLDRDGVINRRPRRGMYVTKWNEFIFLPKSIDALALLQKKGFKLYIITNQAGIARKKVTRKKVDSIHARLIKELHKFGITISDIFLCPHGWNEECFCRKPNPGLFFQAASKHDLNLYESICIGDDKRDILAGVRAGCKTIFVGNKKDQFTQKDKLGAFYRNLYEAAVSL